MRGNKRVIRELLAAEGQLDPEVERELIELRRACFASEDMREGVRAFAEKRPARWKALARTPATRSERPGRRATGSERVSPLERPRPDSRRRPARAAYVSAPCRR